MNVLIVCGGYNVKDYCTKPFSMNCAPWPRKKFLWEVCAPAAMFGAAGLLDGYRSTIHWENIASMREAVSQAEYFLEPVCD